jgi:alpha-D-ribose 1-methylphosphonate 5-triphosphate synthase subunit PhnG
MCDELASQQVGMAAIMGTTGVCGNRFELGDQVVSAVILVTICACGNVTAQIAHA